jgi:hypothetical protein
MNCVNCYKIYNKVVTHESDICPLSSGLVCIRCNMKGHFASNCDKTTKDVCRPSFLEDLIPYTLRKKYNIHTHTPIDSTITEKKMEELTVTTIVVKMDNKNIVNTLKSFSVGFSDDKDSNIHLLCTYAKERGMKIKFLTS